MDSLGRRFYGVSERTYERDFKQYMNSIPLERLPSKTSIRQQNPQTPPSPTGNNQPSNISSGLETTKNILKTVLTVVVIIGVVRILKRAYDEMEALNQEREEGQETGDALDRIFGSEYQSKFRNSVVNRGGYKSIEEENRLRGVKDSQLTTSGQELRDLIPNPDEPITEGLRLIINNTEFPKAEVLGKLMESRFHRELFRTMFMGYTFRELMSSTCDNPQYLPQAANYILSSITKYVINEA